MRNKYIFPAMLAIGSIVTAAAAFYMVNRTIDPDNNLNGSGYSKAQHIAAFEKLNKGSRLLLNCLKTGDQQSCDQHQQLKAEYEPVLNAVSKPLKDEKRKKLIEDIKLYLTVRQSYARQCENMSKQSVPCLMVVDQDRSIKFLEQELADLE
jgi:hypothetical protein